MADQSSVLGYVSSGFEHKAKVRKWNRTLDGKYDKNVRHIKIVASEEKARAHRHTEREKFVIRSVSTDAKTVKRCVSERASDRKLRTTQTNYKQ